MPSKKLLPENKTGSYINSAKSGYLGSSFSLDGSNNGSAQNTPNDKLRRAVIPTKDNPPPEMSEWLVQFQVCCITLGCLLY